MSLIIRGRTPTNVFGLHKSDENSATYAMGWAMEKSALFTEALLEKLTGAPMSADGAIVELQKHGVDKGFSDVELHVGEAFQAIIEAKMSWNVPTAQQLQNTGRGSSPARRRAR